MDQLPVAIDSLTMWQAPRKQSEVDNALTLLKHASVQLILHLQHLFAVGMTVADPFTVAFYFLLQCTFNHTSKPLLAMMLHPL